MRTERGCVGLEVLIFVIWTIVIGGAAGAVVDLVDHPESLPRLEGGFDIEEKYDLHG